MDIKEGRNAPVKLFVSYSHQDEVFRGELDTHTSPLYRENLLAVWHDRCIEPGLPWELEISSKIETSEIIVLLVSPDFFASEYCYGDLPPTRRTNLK